MMLDRMTLLTKLNVGDIFHAQAPSGASLICLVLSVDKGTIQARRVTTQENIEFNRRTGVKVGDDRESPCVIDSVAPLPAEIHNVFLELDQKYKVLMAMDEKSRFADLERLKLTDAEKKALLFVDSHYSSNRLSDSA
jgi:hypothetical protein